MNFADGAAVTAEPTRARPDPMEQARVASKPYRLLVTLHSFRLEGYGKRQPSGTFPADDHPITADGRRQTIFSVTAGKNERLVGRRHFSKAAR
jgi:hypothetical protein